MNGDYTLARVARDFHPLALGPHPQRELTQMPRLGFACPRLGMAAGAFCTGAGAPPPARTYADASPRIRMSSARHGRGRFCTGAGAPPPARTDADTSPQIKSPRLGVAAGAAHNFTSRRVRIRTGETALAGGLTLIYLSTTEGTEDRRIKPVNTHDFPPRPPCPQWWSVQTRE